MAHFVLVESWLEGHGRVLPDLLTDEGHTWTFVTRRPEHYLTNGVQHPILEKASAIEIVETNSVAATVPVVRRLLDTSAHAVFTVCDYYIPQVQRICELLGIPSAYSAAAVTTRDKAQTRRLLDAAGVPNARYTLTPDVEVALGFARATGFPVVCKPADLASSALVQRVDTEAELCAAFALVAAMRQNFRGQPRDAAVLVEEWLAGPEFSVEAVSRGGCTSVLGVTDKVLAGEPYFIEVGHQFPARLSELDRIRIEEFVKRCLDAVGFRDGVSHTELRLTENGPRLLEINPRPGGNYIVDLVRMVTGIDLLRVQLDQCLGKRPNSWPACSDSAGRASPGRARSAASAMVIPERAGTVVRIEGAGHAVDTPGVTKVEMFVECPVEVGDPIDNSCYLGVVLTADPGGLHAGAQAQEIARHIQPVFHDEIVTTGRA